MTFSNPDPNGTAQLAIANLLELNGDKVYRFQNFFNNRSIFHDGHNWQFLPFAFTGVTFNRSGENSQSEIVLPNKVVSRQFLNNAVNEQWTAKVYIFYVNDIDPSSGVSDTPQDMNILYTYTAQVSGGAWKAAELIMTLSSILDAVEATIPLRNYEVEQIGPVPISGNIAL